MTTGEQTVGVAVPFHAEQARGEGDELSTPKGWRRIYAYTNDREVLICGDPPSEAEGVADDDEAGHNCDAMGCSTLSHVLVRLPLPAPWGATTLQGEWERLNRAVLTGFVTAYPNHAYGADPAAAVNVLAADLVQTRRELAVTTAEIVRMESATDAAPSEPETSAPPAKAVEYVPQISPENFWRNVFHTDCPARSGIMKAQGQEHDRQLEDGSWLRLYECLMCGVFAHAGLNAKRFVIVKPATAPIPSEPDTSATPGTSSPVDAVEHTQGEAHPEQVSK